jgi:hypothetical protein
VKRYLENPVFHSSGTDAAQTSTSASMTWRDRRALFHEKQAWARTSCFDELAEVSGHRLETVCHENAPLIGGDPQDVSIRKAVKLGPVCG